jgi:hypothetical protein
MYKGKEFVKHLFKKKHNYKQFLVLSNIINLAQLAIQENDQENCCRSLGFVLENTKDLQLLVQGAFLFDENSNSKAKQRDFSSYRISYR